MRRRRKRYDRRIKRTCPLHGHKLINIEAGVDRLRCPEPGCEIRCSTDSTSTPCDLTTAILRGALHDLFDPLWESGSVFASDGIPRTRHRLQAYRWLARKLSISQANCHVGYFDADTCRRAIEFVKAIGVRDNGIVDRGKASADSAA